MASDNNTLDFTRDIDGWDGPEDNRVVVDSGANVDLKQAFSLDRAANNTLMGFEVSGRYILAAVELSGRATGNQLGPGLIVSGITSGVGIRLIGAEVVDNRVVGSWCGITGDGTRVSPVADDCVQVLDGAQCKRDWGPRAGRSERVGSQRAGRGRVGLKGVVRHPD